MLASYKMLSESLEDTVATASENYESIPEDFAEYKYQDMLSDIRKDLDYFKNRLDDSTSEAAKEKYRKIISDLLNQEKELILLDTPEEKQQLDKNRYIGDKVARNLAQ